MDRDESLKPPEDRSEGIAGWTHRRASGEGLLTSAGRTFACFGGVDPARISFRVACPGAAPLLAADLTQPCRYGADPMWASLNAAIRISAHLMGAKLLCWKRRERGEASVSRPVSPIFVAACLFPRQNERREVRDDL
jgi:hypothetical protein